MIIQTLDLNLIPGRVLPMVNVSQYDKDSRTLEFTIYNGDQLFDLTGLSAYIQGLKPDGHGFNYSATIADGKVTANVEEQMTVVAGRVMCEIILMDGTDRAGTGNFILNVEAAAMPDGSNMSESDYSYIEELIEDAQEAATDSEAWAVGERGGVPVGPTDPTYHNNSHYWSQQAAANDMTGATATTPGVHGLAPAPAAGDQDKFLKGDGTWSNPPYPSDMTGATALLPGTHGLVPAPAAGDEDKVLKGDGTWGTPPSGGHTIQNPSGTDMTQRSTLQFTGSGVTVSDDAINDKTVVGITAGGLLPHLVITSEAGATITITKDGTTISALETTSGTFEVDVPSFGTWTIIMNYGGDTYNQNVTIDTVKIYTTTIMAFSATILVTYPSGATCTCTGEGQSYTASGTPYTFTVHSTGTFTITVTLDGVSKTDTMVITEDGQASAVTIKFGTINLTLANEFVGLSITCVNGGTSISKTASSTSLVFRPPTTGTWTMSGTVNGVTYSTDATISDLDTAVSASLQTVPEGSTVLPTDDIQTWLACAGITDKAYTTLEEVLADSTTLLALISDNNAVDYLVRSKGFTEKSQALVPTMTGYNTPSGEVVYSSEYNNTKYNAWHAFDKDDSTYWQSSNSGNQYIGYHFTSQKCVKKITLKRSSQNGVTDPAKLKISDNGSSWTDVDSFSVSATFDVQKFYIPANTQSKTYAAVELTNYLGGDGIAELQFYSGKSIGDSQNAMQYIGANNYAADTLLADSDWCEEICNSTYFENVLNVKGPTMTGNTTPSGTCIKSSILGAEYDAYKAFDNDDSTRWVSQEQTTFSQQYIGYEFPSTIDCYLARIKNDVRSVTGVVTSTGNAIQGSDGNTWATLADDISVAWNGIFQNIILGKSSYQSFRLLINNPMYSSTNKHADLASMQFYGREDV